MMNWIREEIPIDFPVPGAVQELISELEVLDAAEDYAYFNYCDAFDVSLKELARQGKITVEQWDQLAMKYVYV